MNTLSRLAHKQANLFVLAIVFIIASEGVVIFANFSHNLADTEFSAALIPTPTQQQPVPPDLLGLWRFEGYYKQFPEGGNAWQKVKLLRIAAGLRYKEFTSRGTCVSFEIVPDGGLEGFRVPFGVQSPRLQATL